MSITGAAAPAGTLAVALSAVPSAPAAARGGSYAGKIHATDASDARNDSPIRFRVDARGRRITGLKAELFYGCFIGGSFTLQSYIFPSFHKGPIVIRSDGRFSATDVVDRQAGFVVRFSGRITGSRVNGTLSLRTTTRGNACGRTFTWSARRRQARLLVDPPVPPHRSAGRRPAPGGSAATSSAAWSRSASRSRSTGCRSGTGS